MDVNVREGDMIVPRTPPSEPLKVQVLDFLHAVTGEIPKPKGDSHFALMCVKIIAAAEQSVAMGGSPVKIG